MAKVRETQSLVAHLKRTTVGTCPPDALRKGWLAYAETWEWCKTTKPRAHGTVLIPDLSIVARILPPGNTYIRVNEPLAVFAEVHNWLHRDEREDAIPRLAGDARIARSAVVGGQGFRVFRGLGGKATRLKHIGGVVVGERVGIGAHSCVDRGTFGDTTIERDAQIDNLVQIGHGARIMHDAVICAHSCVGGSAVIGAGAFLGLGVVVAPGVRVGDGAIVNMGAIVTKNVPPSVTVSGFYARYDEAWRNVQKQQFDEWGGSFGEA